MSCNAKKWTRNIFEVTVKTHDPVLSIPDAGVPWHSVVSVVSGRSDVDLLFVFVFGFPGQWRTFVTNFGRRLQNTHFVGSLAAWRHGRVGP